MVDTVHEGYLAEPEFRQTGFTVQTGIQHSVCRLYTEVYTFVLVAWLTRIFFNFFVKVFTNVKKKLFHWPRMSSLTVETPLRVNL